MIQILVSGLALGSIYGLVALGFFITFKASETMNFGQGDALMLGAMLGFTTAGLWGLPYPIAAVLTLLLSAGYGVLVYWLAIRPLSELRSMRWIVTTLGIGLITANLAAMAWGVSIRRMPNPFPDTIIFIFGAGVFPAQLAVIVVTAVLVLGLWAVMNWTQLGRIFKTVAYSHDVARLQGINVLLVVLGAFALSGAIAGLGGLVVAPVTNAHVYMGLPLALKGFGAAIVGGLEDPRGVWLGGLIIGLTEVMVKSQTSVFGDAIVFLLVILVLIVRPEGMISHARLRKV